jgi:hypothetical protein
MSSTDDDKRNLALDWLRDWSKWLITVNFAAALGCSMAQSSVNGPLRPFLLYAIALFAFATICAVGLVGAVASIVERLPSKAHEKSVFNERVLLFLSIRQIAALQFISMVLGGCFFVTWIARRVPATEDPHRIDFRASIADVQQRILSPDYRISSDPQLSLEADITLVNFGDANITISDVRMFAEAFDKTYPTHPTLDDVPKGAVGGYDVSWHIPPYAALPNTISKRHVDFDPILLPTMNRYHEDSTIIIVGVEYELGSV